jgi:hypothetical protein
MKIAGFGSDPLVRGIDPDPRIRIHTKISWIRNTGYNYSIKLNFIPYLMQRFLKLAVRAPTVLRYFHIFFSFRFRERCAGECQPIKPGSLALWRLPRHELHLSVIIFYLNILARILDFNLLFYLTCLNLIIYLCNSK